MPVEIFCCYARTDRLLLNRLIPYLAPLQRLGLITLWSDIDIDGGAEWKKEIEKHLVHIHATSSTMESGGS